MDDVNDGDYPIANAAIEVHPGIPVDNFIRTLAKKDAEIEQLILKERVRNETTMEAILQTSHRQALEMEAQAKNKDATINSLKARVLMLETQLSTTDVETKNLQMGKQNLETQLNQANSRLSDLVCQLSNNSITLQGKLDVATQVYDATLAEKVALITQVQQSGFHRGR